MTTSQQGGEASQQGPSDRLGRLEFVDAIRVAIIVVVIAHHAARVAVRCRDYRAG